MKINEILSGRGKRHAIAKAKSTVLTTMVVASIVVSFAIVTLNFLWDLRGYNSRVLSGKQAAQATLEQNVESAEALKAQFEIFEQGDIKSKEVLDALPSKYDFAALLTSMDILAKRSGMVMDGFVGTDESDVAAQSAVNPEPVEIPFSITVIGRYDDLKKFMGNLEKSIRPMKITSLTISGNDNSLKADISIVTYYQPQADIGVEKVQVQ